MILHWLVSLALMPLFVHGDVAWIQNSPRFKWCCGPKDCFMVPRDHVRMTRGGYVMQTPAGDTITIPFAETFISETDDFWICLMPTGERRCFFAPPLGA